MPFHRRDAGRGIAWLTEAVEILLRNPLPFVVMGLVVALIVSVPLLGGLLLSVFGPALNGGVIHAARTQASGGQADVSQLFRAFQQPGILPRMLALCLPGIAGGLLIAMLAVSFVGSALLAAGISQAADAEALSEVTLGSGGALFALLAIGVALIAFGMVFFATPRVMLAGDEPFAAMLLSLRATLANALPILVYMLCLLFAGMLVAMVIELLSVQLARLAVITLAFPLAATVMWVAARDVFADDQADAGQDDRPAPPTLEP